MAFFGMKALISVLSVRAFLLAVLGGQTAVAVEELSDVVLGLTGHTVPLVGVGVGNLPHELIVQQVSTALGNEMKYRLIDTAAASQNEHLVRMGVEQANLDEGDVVHVVTKVWYTYLGYERTRLSIQSSLQNLRHPNIRVHILLHWPRCRDDISWMNCELEEKRLPQHVKKAGPAPHLDKLNAWKESWRAMEDIVTGDLKLEGENLPPIESLGVSNFDLGDLRDLVQIARVMPGFVQGNIWSYLHDFHLLHYMHHHNVHFQAYNIMNGIVSRVKDFSYADNLLLQVVKEVTDGSAREFSRGEVILAFLVHKEVSVVLRTSTQDHLQQNSPRAIADVPRLTTTQQKHVERALAAIIAGKDLPPSQVTFHNKDEIHLYWYNHHNGEEVPIKENLQAGSKTRQQSAVGHKFIAYNADKSRGMEFVVPPSEEEIDFHIDFHAEL